MHTCGPKNKCLLSNSENYDINYLISGMFIVYWSITIKLRICKHSKQTSKPQTNITVAVCDFSYHALYWLISSYTITFHKYFWCSQFCEFHSNAICHNDKYFPKRKFKLFYSLQVSTAGSPPFHLKSV